MDKAVIHSRHPDADKLNWNYTARNICVGSEKSRLGWQVVSRWECAYICNPC